MDNPNNRGFKASFPVVPNDTQAHYSPSNTHYKTSDYRFLADYSNSKLKTSFHLGKREAFIAWMEWIWFHLSWEKALSLGLVPS